MNQQHPSSAHASTVETVQVNGIRVSVRRSGSGEPILLLHGFPHTKELWRNVEPLLTAGGHQVIAPDLRGLGDSERARTGFEAQNQAKDQVRLLDALAVDAAHVVGFDVGAAVAFALTTQHSGRVRSLTIMEAIVGGLPGAEEFFRAGGPWWFGFHQAPGGLAEDIVAGSEDRYIRYFLESRARTHLPDDLAKRFIQAYTGRDSLRAAFEHYRAMPSNAETNSSWAEHGRLNLPVAAVTSTVGGLLARQLAPFADDLEEHLLPDSGHVVPLDAPQEVAEILLATAARAA
ncbi:MAG: alpha/beta hydrolase [Microbacterium sp.]